MNVAWREEELPLIYACSSVEGTKENKILTAGKY